MRPLHPERAPWLAAALLLLVAGSTAAAPPARTAPRPSGQQPSPPAPSRLGHTVRPGENLWTIARRHGVNADDLARLNRLEPGQPLRVGQYLALPKNPATAESEEPASLAEITLGRPPIATTVPFGWPVVGGVGSPFGPRRRGWHGGIDIRAERGTPIRAAADGMVIMSGRERAYGRVVKMWHAEGLMTVYAHNQENYAKVGDWVERGQVIATIGATGRATGTHLHFEIRLDGRKYDPLFWLPRIDAVNGAPTPSRTESSP
jgi:murein DD-endopeptidase MepM/ murein hydrolase activator NlpD